MAEKDTIFSSKIKYDGIFDFKEFYKFCYQWASEEMGYSISEDKYAEKISGDSKNIFRKSDRRRNRNKHLGSC